jgi:uncharacterized protein (DUF2252 family)
MSHESHPYKTLQQRREQGRAQRKVVRRQDQAQWSAALRNGHPDPQTLLDASMKGRVPDLVDEKYRRMMLSPFGYFRGAVPVMAADLSRLPHTGILCQLCGDAHVRNLGAYAGVDGRLVFDINDFDETIRGPFEWDLKRIAASFVLAGQEAGSKPAVSAAAVAVFADTYREQVHSFATMPLLQVARWQVHRLHAVKPVSAALLKAQRATAMDSLKQLTYSVKTGGKTVRRFRKQTGLTLLSAAMRGMVIDSLMEYRTSLLPERRHLLDQYKPEDAAFKVVGTGSVGLRDYVVYLTGNGAEDPLFLQLKEEPDSAYMRYLKAKPAPQNGRRVAEGQRAMQLQSDAFLGWTSIDGRDYLVRQLNDHKGSIDVDAMDGNGLREYAMICAELLARGHARSGDAGIISGYLGTSTRFDTALLKFAKSYAEQTVADWKKLCAARGVKAAPLK